MIMVYLADADFVWNKVTNDLILTGIDAGIILGVITTEPPGTSSWLLIYSKLIAGKGVLKVKGSWFRFSITNSILAKQYYNVESNNSNCWCMVRDNW
jgi:hypothetical protein